MATAHYAEHPSFNVLIETLPHACFLCAVFFFYFSVCCHREQIWPTPSPLESYSAGLADSVWANNTSKCDAAAVGGSIF